MLFDFSKPCIEKDNLKKLGLEPHFAEVKASSSNLEGWGLRFISFWAPCLILEVLELWLLHNSFPLLFHQVGLEVAMSVTISPPLLRPKSYFPQPLPTTCTMKWSVVNGVFTKRTADLLGWPDTLLDITWYHEAKLSLNTISNVWVNGGNLWDFLIYLINYFSNDTIKLLFLICCSYKFIYL